MIKVECFFSIFFTEYPTLVLKSMTSRSQIYSKIFQWKTLVTKNTMTKKISLNGVLMKIYESLKLVKNENDLIVVYLFRNTFKIAIFYRLFFLDDEKHKTIW